MLCQKSCVVIGILRVRHVLPRYLLPCLLSWRRRGRGLLLQGPADIQGWETECRDYNTEGSQCGNLLPASASSPQCPVKKLDFHDAVADRFRKTLAILCFLKNVLILWNNIQSDIKDKLCWVLHIFCTFRKVYNSSFEKIVFRIKSLQEPSLPVRDKIWDKINIDRLIIAIK